MKSLHIEVFAILLIYTCLSLKSSIAMSTLNESKIGSLVDFMEATGLPNSHQRVWEAVGAEKDNTMLSMPKLQSIGKMLDLSLQRKWMTLKQIRQHGGVALLHMRTPEQFETVVGIGDQQCAVLRDGAIDVIDNATMARRFTGETLFLVNSSRIEPSLTITAPVITTDITSSNAIIAQKVVFTNRGLQAIKLKVESESCNCTEAELSTQTLIPGSTGTLNIRMEADGWGTKIVTVTIRTDDPLWPHVIVTLQAKTPMAATSLPDRLLVNGTEGQPQRRGLTLLLSQNVTLAKISTTLPFVAIKTVGVESVEGGTAHRFAVSVAATVPPGPFAGKIVFDLKGSRTPQITVPISGLIEPDIEAIPHSLFVSSIPSGGKFQYTVTVQSHNGHNFAVKSAQSSNPHIVSQIDTGAVASRHQVRIEFTATGEPGSVIQDAIKIVLSSGVTLNLPVVGMIARSDKTATPPNK